MDPLFRGDDNFNYELYELVKQLNKIRVNSWAIRVIRGFIFFVPVP